MDLQVIRTLPETLNDDPSGLDISAAEVARVVSVSPSNISLLDIGGEAPAMDRAVGSSGASCLIRHAVHFDDDVTRSCPLVQSVCRSHWDGSHRTIPRSVESLRRAGWSGAEVSLRRGLNITSARLVVPAQNVLE